MKKRDLARSTVSLGAAALLGIAAPACSHQKTAPADTTPATTSPTAGEPTATPPATAEPTATPPATAEPTATPPAATTQPAKPDCQGADRFTEACGYASPTRYAVLDPASIVNA